MNDSTQNAISLTSGRLEIRFLGKRAPADRAAALRSATSGPLELAVLHQIHSSTVVEADSGKCGKADGLVTSRTGIALSLVTADCVPVIIGNQRRVAAVHAGWRGIAGGIVERAVDALGGGDSLAAWTGPAIGPCCYEVDHDVAGRIAAASHDRVLSPGPSGRPHADLPGAVDRQLRSLGVEQIHHLDVCTRCNPDAYWSYRRSGPRAGRNFTFAWLADRGEECA